MNFLNFLTSGAGIFNFNLQNMSLNANTAPMLRPLSTHTILNKEEYQTQQKPKPKTSEPTIPEPTRVCDNMLTTSQTQLLTHHQQLINQYMHLNIQLLSRKIQSLEHQPQKKEQSSVTEIKSNKKKIKKLNVTCGHNDREHYAKGMCNNCYHKNGRTKKPWKCGHQKLYANGLCQNCYINKYNKMKRQRVNNSQNFEISESRQMNSEAKIEEI